MSHEPSVENAMVELLEPRTHLSASSRVILEINGTAGPDAIVVFVRTASNGRLQLRVNNNHVITAYAIRTIRCVRVHSFAGDDRIDLDQTADIRVAADGGADDDTLYVGDGNDTLIGNAGNDTVWGGGGNDLIYGGDGMDLLEGSDGNDSIYGGDGDDFLIADGGVNFLVAGPGVDEVWAGVDSGGTIDTRDNQDDFITTSHTVTETFLTDEFDTVSYND